MQTWKFKEKRRFKQANRDEICTYLKAASAQDYN